ncbi:MAG TPA: hypothetical protein ENI99_05545 [Sedimenticola sp.]|nr:hypothetical protein [Sedimenticola sp.]
MVKQRYSASKTRSQGRNAWAVTFRHPVVKKDPRSSSGIKVRRGLGTPDEAEADKLVDEMNILLGDESYWSLSQKGRAERQFAKVIVDAFYEPMVADAHLDPWKARDEVIPIPSAEDGFTKVLFLGTTGAGKTSLLRHLIGSHPEKDRFPSTSTGKTTVSDIEVITDHEGYQAVVTFFPEGTVRTYTQESVDEACKAVWRGESDEKVVKELLNHKEQRFRLSYLLGSWSAQEIQGDDDDWGFDDVEEDVEPTAEQVSEEGIYPSVEERREMQEKLSEYAGRIREIAESAIAKVSEEWGEDVLRLKGEDLDLVLDYFEEILGKMPGYDALIEDIIEQVLKRFDYLAAGKLRRKGKWPDRWTFESADRDEFINQVRWFSSNYAPAFGRLLTPLVQGVRVRGPFFAEALGDTRGLVLMDGEGLGHVAETVADVSTHFTSRYQMADVILLVDNAQQPMQAAPLSVVRSVATSGHQDKLAIAFTHFDQVKGVNFSGFSDRRDHVLASVKNALSNMRTTVGDSVINSMEGHLYNRCFMLGALDKPASKIPKGVFSQLNALVDFFRSAIEPYEPPAVAPVYDPASMSFAVQAATQEFQSLWNARLGYQYQESVSKEHWTRIKALTRRVARMGGVEYDYLRPVAELIARLSEGISRFLDKPVQWDPHGQNEEEESEAIDVVRSEVFQSLHSLAMERLIQEHLVDWSRAFERAGRGSSYDRARDVRNIYQTAAPVPGIELTPQSSEFLSNVRELVFDAIENAGGKIITVRGS